jgi:nucleotide sugar dehydrogenase
MNKTICVVGMGYVGLPLAVEFEQEGFDVIGYDIDSTKIDQLNSGIDPTNELGNQTVAASSIEFTTDESTLKQADYILVTVPTPVDDLKNPNLKYVQSAAETIGRNIQPGAIVVLESTVYPGATREILAPTIENESGLTVGEGFYIGYSPERMVPGDDEHGMRDVVKIVSGQNDSVRSELAELYRTIVDAGVHEAPEIEVAEAAKAIENIQRDVNIALMNELAIACHSIGVDTHDVLEAARTKWNFHKIEDSSMNFFQSLIYNIRSERYKSRLSKHYDSITGDINFNSDYVFFTLHYQPERTTCPEGGVFVDQYIAVNLLSNCIPDDWKLYVKEHPHQTSQKYNGELGRKKYMYDDLNELDSVTLVDTDVESFDLIDNAQATATITGTSGWESINRGVPAIVFGSGWYRDCPGCIHVETQEEVKQAIKKVQSGYSVHKTDIRRFMNELEKISQRVYVSSGTKNGSRCKVF